MKSAISIAAIGFFAATSAFAQAQQGTPPERIDLTIREEEPDEEELFEDCSEEQQAASISGEIIVCRRKTDTKGTGFDKEDWERRYADKTRDKGDPRAPDLEPKYPGVVVARGCFIGTCPPPPAYFIDFSELPEAPPGSDADRIARGLAPLGRDGSAATVANPALQAELGLPDTPTVDAEVSPSGSASPAAEPSG